MTPEEFKWYRLLETYGIEDLLERLGVDSMDLLEILLENELVTNEDIEDLNDEV